MDSELLLSRLRALAREVSSRVPEDLPASASFREDCNLDSLDLVEYVARIEQEFGISIPDGDVERFSSLRATAIYLEERMEP